MLGRLNRWARAWLWSWAALLAIVLALARVLGSWGKAWHVYTVVGLAAMAVAFAWLLYAGWREWRGRDAEGEPRRPPRA